MPNFPTSLPSITNPTANDTLAGVPHHTQHRTVNDEVTAVATKVGTGSSSPASGTFLIGSGTGTSAWVDAISAASSASTPLKVKGAASQTADLSQWQTSAGTVYVRVRAEGQLGGLVHIVDSSLDTPTGAHFTGWTSQVVFKGPSPLSALYRAAGGRIIAGDQAGVTQKTVTGAADNGSGAIRITAAGHGYSTGDAIALNGIGGTTEANDRWRITRIDANNFDLIGSTFTHAYTSGGYATNAGMGSGLIVEVAPTVDRVAYPLANGALHGHDIAGISITNTGTASGNDGLYFSQAPFAGSAWASVVTIDVDADSGFRIGDHTVGIGLDFANATFTTAPIVIPNASSFSALSNAGVVTPLFKYDGADRFAIQAQVLIGNNVSFQLSTTAGPKWGTAANQQQAWWGATPVVQPAAADVTPATAVEPGAGSAITSTMTFDGWTLAKVVGALRLVGILA